MCKLTSSNVQFIQDILLRLLYLKIIFSCFYSGWCTGWSLPSSRTPNSFQTFLSVGSHSTGSSRFGQFFLIQIKVKRNNIKSPFVDLSLPAAIGSEWAIWQKIMSQNCDALCFLRTVLVPRLVHVPDGRLDSDIQEVCHPSLHEASGFHRRIHQQGKEPRGRGLRERLIYCPNAKLCTSVLVYRLQTLQQLKRISLICQTV